MDLEASLKFVETYAKSYLHHILSFFGEHRHADEAAEEPLNDGTLLIFALMNAVIGAALRGLFVSKISFKDINFPQSVIIEVCYWLTLCILLHIILTRPKSPSHFSDAITAILSVLPVSFVIGAYAGFVVYYISLGPFHGDKAPWLAALANALVQVWVLAWFLHRYVEKIRGPTPGRKVIGSVVIILLVAGVHALVLFATSNVLFDAKDSSTAKTSSQGQRDRPSIAGLPRLAALILMVGLLAWTAPNGAFAQTPLPPPSPPVAETASATGASGSIEEGNLFARAWRNGREAFDSVVDWFGGRHRSPAPRYETQVYLLDSPLDQPALPAVDATNLAEAAQYANLYASPRILIEMAGRPNSALAAGLRQHAALAQELLAQAGVDRAKIFIDFRKGSRLPPGKLLQVSVYF